MHTHQEPTETSKQPIRARYLGHVTGYHPIRDQYFLIRSVPGTQTSLTTADVDKVLLVHHLQVVRLTESLAAPGTFDTLEMEGVITPNQPLSLDVLAADLAFVPVEFVVAPNTQWLVVPAEEGEGVLVLGCPKPPDEPTDTSKQPIRTRYLGHVTGYQPRLEMLEKLEIAQDTKMQKDWALARAARNSHSKIRVYSKRKCWKAWTEELDAFSDAQKISHVIKTSEGCKLNCVNDKNGNITSSPKETLLAMADVHFGDHNITRPSTQDYDKIGRRKWSNEKTFSTTRIIKALREFRPLTAAGPDSIRPIMMQKIADTFAKYFAKIVTASYELGKTPTRWQEVKRKQSTYPNQGKEITASHCINQKCPKPPDEPTDTSKQPIRTRYLGHVTGYQPRLEMLEKLEIAQDTKMQKDWALARAARNSHSKIRVYSKRKCWKAWTEELDAFSDAQKISHVIKTSEGCKLNCVNDKNGNITSSPKETLLAMADVHFGDHNITRPSTQDYDKIGRRKWSNEKTFSTTRILCALPARSAIYLPKPGKGDYRQPKSFRTIADTLASNLQKIKLAERLVLWHIEADQKVHKKLNKSQYGFKRGVSTETALHKVVRKIEKTLMNQGIALGTFLDIEGAFDNVAFKAIERALHAKLRDKRTVDWIMFTITNRKVTTKLLGESLTIMVTRGCPQGGILSPFLWNLVMDDLLNHSKKEIPGDLQGFADDLSLLVTTTMPPSKAGPSVDILPLRDATQKGLTAINKWCKTVGLKLSALKSHIVIFTHRQNVKINDPIKIGGNSINTVSAGWQGA
eukprot:sb/3479343/